MTLDHFLVIVHFIGLALGFSTGFANVVMAGLIRRAAPQEQAVLRRFPPAMAPLGVIGLVLLWTSGLTIIYTRYGTFAILPQTFVVKLSAVVLLTLAVAYMQVLQRRARSGDAGAMARIEALGRATGPLALIAVIFAVITFG
jgi:hypothetical protein